MVAHLKRLIEERIAVLVPPDDLDDLRYKVDSNDCDLAFVQNMVLGLQERLRETEDLSIDQLLKIEAEVKGISAWRLESDEKLTVLDSKAEELDAYVRQLRLTLDLESQEGDGGSGDAVAVSTMAPPSASQTSPGSQDEGETAEQPSMEASTAEMVSAGSVQV